MKGKLAKPQTPPGSQQAEPWGTQVSLLNFPGEVIAPSPAPRGVCPHPPTHRGSPKGLRPQEKC